MRYADLLRKKFPGIELRGAGLFLLEDFQIKYLQDRVPVKEFAIFLHANPTVQDFLTLKYPPVTDFIRTLLWEYFPADTDEIISFQGMPIDGGKKRMCHKLVTYHEEQ